MIFAGYQVLVLSAFIRTCCPTMPLLHMTIESGDCVLVLVNVHSESDLALRSLRGRLRLVARRWPWYPGAIGVIIGDLNLFESEEGRSQRLEPNLHRW